jgi:hypothetical protein
MLLEVGAVSFGNASDVANYIATGLAVSAAVVAATLF